MIGGLALVGVIVLAFGLFTRQALAAETPFVMLHLVVGGSALATAALFALLRIGRSRQPALLGPALRAIGGGVATGVVALLLYQGVVLADVRLDWTFEGRFALSEATRTVLAELPAPLALHLYFDPGDPRIRNTKLLLEEFAHGHDVAVDVRRIDAFPEEEDRYGIGSSNSVVVALGDRWELVERPSEGALYQAISALVRDPMRVLYVTVGGGEGDLERSDDLGFSGLRAALESEGFEPRPLPLAIVDEIPDDASAVLIIAPRRGLPDAAREALERYVDQGGRLVVFLEPDTTTGLEPLLAGFGITPQPGRVVDPASGPIEGDAPGRNPIASAYASHPVTKGLEANRMTFFRGARSFALRKARPDDRLRAVVLTSGMAWIDASDAEDAEASPPPFPPLPPADVRADYQPLVVAAELERNGRQARLVVFGDADVASNRYLRALYNLDLVLNAIHWVTEHETAIAIRPKTGGRGLVQFPLPLQTSLQSLYGVGLLVPELLLITGALVWLYQREV